MRFVADGLLKSREVPMLRLALLALLALTACGKDDDSDSNGVERALEGDWWVDTSASCGIGLAIGGSDYAQTTVCVTSGNAANVERAEGTIESDGEKLQLTPARKTCEDVGNIETYPYSVSGSSLRLNLGTTLVVLDKLGSSGEAGGGAIITLGCFSESGEFFPHEMKEKG